MGERPITEPVEPVEGTTEDFGLVATPPDSEGAGAGAKNEVLLTEEGGAISGGK